MSNVTAQNEALQNEIFSIKEEWQGAQMKMTGEQKVRLDLFYGLLSHLNTLENYMEILVENYQVRFLTFLLLNDSNAYLIFL